MSKSLALACLLFSPLVFAQSPDIASTIPTLLIGLVIMVVVIYLLAGLAKKTNFMQMKSAGMKVISVLPVSGREKIMIVEVGNEQLVLGVTAHSINLIKTLEEPIEITNQDFKQTLSKFMQPNNKHNND